MIDKFIFWAQALDNSSPDHIEMQNKAIDTEDIAGRQKATSHVAQVIRSGRCLFKKQGVQLTVNDQHFVIEVPSAQQDSVGRTAPIVCFGSYGFDAGDALGESVVIALDSFATRIERTIHPEHLKIARDSIATLKKKSPMRTIIQWAMIGMMVLALAAFTWWMNSRDL